MKKELFGNIDVDKIKHNSVSNIPPCFRSKKKMDEVEQMKKQLFGDKYKENIIKCRDQIGMMFHLKQKQEEYIKQKQEEIEHLNKEFKEQIEKTQKEKLNKNPFDILYFEEPRSLNPELFEQELQVREIVKHLKSKTVKQANIYSHEKVIHPITINEDIIHPSATDDIHPTTINEDVWKKYEITNPNDYKPKIIKNTRIDINTLLEMEAKQSEQNEEREQIMDILR